MKTLLSLFLVTFFLTPLAANALPVAYKGTCFYSADAAYTAFQADWPQMSNGINYSLFTSTLSGSDVVYTLIDHNHVTYADLYLTFANCSTSSFSAYAVQDFLFPAMLTFSLLLGFGHGYKLTGSA